MNNLLVPLYLGKSVFSTTYYFLADKDGLRRFIKYIRYPMWAGCVHLVDSFSNDPCPEEILQEVANFVTGKLVVEVIPKTRGRAERIIKTEKNGDGDGNMESSTSNGENIPIAEKGGRKQESQKSGSVHKIEPNTGSGGGDVRGSVKSPISESGMGREPSSNTIGTAVLIKPKRHRRTKAEMIEARKKEGKEGI